VLHFLVRRDPVCDRDSWHEGARGRRVQSRLKQGSRNESTPLRDSRRAADAGSSSSIPLVRRRSAGGTIDAPIRFDEHGQRRPTRIAGPVQPPASNCVVCEKRVRDGSECEVAVRMAWCSHVSRAMRLGRASHKSVARSEASALLRKWRVAQDPRWSSSPLTPDIRRLLRIMS
jgi:hypothetical protein